MEKLAWDIFMFFGSTCLKLRSGRVVLWLTYIASHYLKHNDTLGEVASCRARNIALSQKT